MRATTSVFRMSGKAVPAWLSAGMIVGLVVFAAALFGILTRPMGFLAAIWPANAILLGLMVRRGELASPTGWIGAFAGFMAADLVTGGDPFISLWLTAANMSGVLTGYVLFQVLPEGDRRLQRPQSVLFLFAICCVSSIAAALTGGGAARVLFGRDFQTGFEFWFVTELVNNLVILPAILSVPDRIDHLMVRRRSDTRRLLWKAAPLAALLASMTMSVVIGGPGAIAFPVPALLWCALSYSVFPTALLSAVFCSWLLIAIPSGIVTINLTDDLIAATSSIRLGIALVALGPLTAATINSARMELLGTLRHTANHDFLTGLPNRGAFMSKAKDLIATADRSARPLTVAMMDVDHFKRVNDHHGHAAGDRALVRLAEVVSTAVRPTDLVGRTGGEEFALVLPDTTLEEAAAIAEDLRRNVQRAPEGQPPDAIPITVSIGLATLDRHGPHSLDTLLATADRALYRAKKSGRNRVAVADAVLPRTPVRRAGRASAPRGDRS